MQKLSVLKLVKETTDKMTLLGLSGLKQDVSQSLELPVDIVTMKALDDDFRDLKTFPCLKKK